MSEVEYPLQVLVSGKNVVQVPQLFRFVVKISMSDFSDSFTMLIGARYAQTLGVFEPFGSVEVKYLGKTVFTGKIEKDETYEKENATYLEVAGRNLVSDFTEDDAPMNKYSKTTDNAVIKEMLGSDFEYDLDAAQKMDEWDIPAGTPRAQAAADAASKTGYQLWFSNGIVYKKKVSESIVFQKQYVTGESNQDGIHIMNNTLRVARDYQGVKSKIAVYASDKNHDAISRSVDILPVLKARSTEVPLTVNRTHRAHIPHKSKDEADKQLENIKASGQPIENVQFEVAGFDDIPINTPVKVIAPSQDVNGVFIVTDKTSTVEQDFTIKTMLTMIPPGRRLSKK